MSWHEKYFYFFFGPGPPAPLGPPKWVDQTALCNISRHTVLVIFAFLSSVKLWQQLARGNPPCLLLVYMWSSSNMVCHPPPTHPPAHFGGPLRCLRGKTSFSAEMAKTKKSQFMTFLGGPVLCGLVEVSQSNPPQLITYRWALKLNGSPLPSPSNISHWIYTKTLHNWGPLPLGRSYRYLLHGFWTHVGDTALPQWRAWGRLVVHFDRYP